MKSKSRKRKHQNDEFSEKIKKIHKIAHTRAKKKTVDDKLKDLLIFIVKLNVFLIPLYVMIYYRIDFTWLENVITRSVVGLLRASGIWATYFGNFISVPTPTGSFGGFITWDCTGWKSIIVFLALVFATPSSWTKKLFSLVYTPFIMLINIFRIWFMFAYVHVFGLQNYDYIHHTLWSYGMVMFVILFWFAWYKFKIPKTLNLNTI